MMRHVVLGAILGMLAMGLVRADAGTPEVVRPPLPKGMRLLVMHPSSDKDGLYTCLLQLPADLKINDALGFGLVLVNRQGDKVGRVPLREDVVGKERMVEFRLNKELIKRSVVGFQVTRDPNAPVFITASPGDEKMIRRDGDKIVREPIE